MVHLRSGSGWDIPVLLTDAARDVGTDAVVDALTRHRTFVAADAERGPRAAQRRTGELVDILDEELRRRLERGLQAAPDGLERLLESVRTGTVDPYTAALRILGDAAALEGLVRERKV